MIIFLSRGSYRNTVGGRGLISARHVRTTGRAQTVGPEYGPFVTFQLQSDDNLSAALSTRKSESSWAVPSEGILAPPISWNPLHARTNSCWSPSPPALPWRWLVACQVLRSAPFLPNQLLSSELIWCGLNPFQVYPSLDTFPQPWGTIQSFLISNSCSFTIVNYAFIKYPI